MKKYILFTVLFILFQGTAFSFQFENQLQFGHRPTDIRRTVPAEIVLNEAFVLVVTDGYVVQRKYEYHGDPMPMVGISDHDPYAPIWEDERFLDSEKQEITDYVWDYRILDKEEP